MKPGAYSLELYRGDSFETDVRVWLDAGKTQPADLTGVEAKAEVRDKSAGSTIIELRVSITGNTITLKVEPDDWDAWTLARGVWDLQLTYPDASVQTILAGNVAVIPDVTDSSPLSTMIAGQSVRKVA